MSLAYSLNYVSGNECRAWTDKAFGILSNSPTGRISEDFTLLNGVLYTLNGGSYSNTSCYKSSSTTNNYTGNATAHIEHDVIKIKNDKKIVGVILDDTAIDTSLKVALLADDFTIRHSGTLSNVDYAHFYDTISTYGTYNYTTTQPNMNANPFLTVTDSPSSGETYGQIIETYDGTVTQPRTDIFDYVLNFQNNINYSLNLGAFHNTGIYQGYDLTTNTNNRTFSTYTLTKEINNTLVIGAPYGGTNRYAFYHPFEMVDPRNYLEGNHYNLLTNMWAKIYSYTRAMPTYLDTSYGRRYVMVEDTQIYSRNLTAYDCLPCNIVLTKSYEQAINYLDNDVMPTDAILFPFDWDNIPKTDGSLPNEGDSDGGDTPGEDGDPTDNLESTPEIAPTTTAQMLTNNNLYWLQAGQLYSFINWFWTEAGEVDDIDALLNKIEGLYSNLGSAIINIRYMPVKPDWIGGISSTDKIVVGMLEHAQNVNIINKSNPIVREIGSIKIDEKFNSFCDYSPYSNISLYLPYHGFIDLDNNLLMGNKLVVRALYDIISGTIQYFIHCEKDGATFLINTIQCKMAVDIPITLQSKSDRDSAIFNNVSSAVGGLLGASASVASGNPIGLVMSTSSLSGSNAQSAPLSVKGTVGDTGANYASPYCAIYIRRPKYNRPNLYASRVGYPCNKNYSIANLSGFFTVYNPQITFTGNYLPLQEEVEELYNLLESGVIK